MSLIIEESWRYQLENELNKSYMLKLCDFLSQQAKAGKIIYPNNDQIFSAFNETSFDNVKAVIIGQDPYHGPNQAHGMCFSVKPGIKPPPSLVNIYKELHEDIGLEVPEHGYLQSWAKEGVLLLNSILTVEESKAGSHKGKGWERFTDEVIKILNEKKENLVFFLWGNPAQKKGALIDQNRHLVLRSVHPSPLSAYRGFLGCKHFSKANEYLYSKALTPISWKLPDSVK